MTGQKFSRRQLLQSASASFAMPALIPSGVLGLGRRPGPNDTVHVAIIGLGGRARSIARESRGIAGMRIVAICDCFAPLCDKFIHDVGQDQNWASYDDFRRMIDKEKLDGVMVETTTHARAWIVIQAMQAGMDVYIEKPMCLTIREGRYMVKAARKYNRITQVGTQQRSMPINNWASDLIKSGGIGKVGTVIAPNFVGPERWKPQPAQPLPKGGKEGWWEVWTNQAPLRPYHRLLHRGWARWWAYDGGGRSFGVTGWGTHSYDQVQRALGTDETGPVEVCLEEPVRVMPAGKFETPRGKPDTGVAFRRLARHVVGPRAKVRMKYANGTELLLHLDGDEGPGLGAIFIGEKGKIEMNRNKLASDPPELVQSPENPGRNRRPESQYHIENWVQCIKTRQPCNADIEYGQRSTTLCYLVNIARELGMVGETLKWDPDSERFSNCEQANRSSYLARPRRAGYELPALT